jgi:hypothetical protein
MVCGRPETAGSAQTPKTRKDSLPAARPRGGLSPERALMFEHAGQTFIVRIMFEPGRRPADPREWRGMIQHVVSGERRSFVGVQQIPDLIIRLLRADAAVGGEGFSDPAERAA